MNSAKDNYGLTGRDPLQEITEVISEFFFNFGATSCCEFLDEMYTAAVGSELQTDMPPDERARQASFYNHLLYFIQQLSTWNLITRYGLSKS